jgi:ADP-ribose pyrophosphatase
MDYKLKKSEIVFKGKMIGLKVDTIEYKNGNTGIREVAIHPGGACIVPVTSEGKIVLLTQFRYPVQKVTLEIPAGKLDNNEDPFVCAARELEEETGYRSNNIIKLGEILTSPGFCTELLHLYIARDLIPGDHNREDGEEGMELFELTFDEIDEKIKNGGLVDAKTICAIYMAKQLLQ